MVPLPFTMWLGERDGVLTARFAGRLASPWADEVHRTLVRRSPGALLLDVTELTGVDPSGLATLVAVRQEVVSGGGFFVLRGASDSVRTAFAANGLEALADDTLEDAAISPVTRLRAKGGPDARRSPAGTPKVA